MPGPIGRQTQLPGLGCLPGIDITGGQWTTFITAQAGDIGQFHALAAGFSLGPRVEGIIVPPRSPITSVAGLRGATIAVNAWTPPT